MDIVYQMQKMLFLISNGDLGSIVILIFVFSFVGFLIKVFAKNFDNKPSDLENRILLYKAQRLNQQKELDIPSYLRKRHDDIDIPAYWRKRMRVGIFKKPINQSKIQR